MPSQGRRTEVYEIRITRENGYHLALSAAFGRKNLRELAAYECLDPDCHWDFRLAVPKGEALDHGVQVACPKCGSLYVEWLSFDVPPVDTCLDTDEEWAQVPMGTLRRPCAS